MNRIRINRMLLAGFVTLITFIALEILVEQVIGRIMFGNMFEQWYQTTNVPAWGIANNVLNIFIALFNCTVLIWLYASLRPMFGVGTRTALITSAFVLILGLSFTINFINLGLVPPMIGMLEWIAEAIEFPIAMIAGALVYEGDIGWMASVSD